MKDLLDFCGEHPWLALLCLIACVTVIEMLFFRLPNRMLRAGNIRQRGWPPPHLDADGEFKPEPEEPTK